nr:HD domain-containing protein [Acidobacteriota bacterium]
PQRENAAVPRLATLVIEARSAASGILLAPQPPALGEQDLAAARDILRTILLIPGAIAAVFSAYGYLGGVQEIASRSALTDEAKNLLQSKLNVWLSKRNDPAGAVRTAVLTPFGTSGPAVTPNDVQKVFTAPLTVGSLRGLYLTVAFAGNPERAAHELLGAMHAQLQTALEQSMQRGALASLRMRVAEKLIEPDLARYPELRRHTYAVAKLSEQLAQSAGLSAAEVENARIVGLVHDAGLRLLDYDRLYRKRDLTAEEMGFLREHPVVGAAIIEPLLGPEIARAVLCHHERTDGRGYPNDLTGEEIPLLSRIVQICDAFVAMTDPDGYQPPETKEAALATIAREAGGQFDATLAGKFVEMMRGGRGGS